MDPDGLAYVLGGIACCAVGLGLLRYRTAIANWQAQMHDGIRRATSGRERAVWDRIAKDYTNTSLNETVTTVLGIVLIGVGLVIMLGYTVWVIWRRFV